MRIYLIDEINPSDIKKIDGFLKKNALQSGMGEIFWVQIPDDILTEMQRQHRKCRPHVFSVELGPDWIKLEFFVRSLKNMRCTCPAYCTSQQTNFIINFAHGMIEDLGIKT